MSKINQAQVISWIQDELDRRHIPGAVLVLVRNDGIIFSKGFGQHDIDSFFPIASATKWISATLMLILVSEGKVGLDDPVVKYIPRFSGEKSHITIRQLLACTSGLPLKVAWQSSSAITLEECVARIARIRLEAPAGSQFIYGGVGFQVAGRIAEVVTGESWHRMFEERIAIPLNMLNTGYGKLDWKRKQLNTKKYSNTRIGGAMWTTPRDYASFLRMQLNDGVSGGQRLLNDYTVKEMRTNQIAHANYTKTAHADPNAVYGLGVWLERIDASGNAILMSCPGAFGFYPWIDFKRGYGGIFAVKYPYRKLAGWYTKMTESIAQALNN
ncbi:MAG: hypothetical protein BMS9Abin06_0015 [Gammaproteobacteria bacterium]|nr:MAG: hypothetical protein BMS9Abin06_0015 [Gammaproteobacteria bacterium]